jgi:hypothetical protein
MTKLQAIEAEFQTLPVQEQRELISKFVHLIAPEQGEYLFSDTEWADIQDRRVNDTKTFTHEEVMASLN